MNDLVVTELGAGNDTTALFTVTLSGPSSSTVSVDYATADGTATTAGGDYDAESGTLTFTSGGSLTQQIPVTVNGDNTPEDPNETFSMVLSNPVNGTLVSNSSVGTATINDNNATVRVNINDIVVNEGDDPTSAIFTLTLSRTSASDVTINMETAPNTALAGSDYVTKTEEVTIEAGDQSATFVVTVVGDNRDEPTQSFYGNIDSVTGAVLADPVKSWGVATVLDDEPRPAISVNNVQLREGDRGTKMATFTLTLSHPSEKPVKVKLRTADGSATFANADYWKTQATVPFQPGDTSYSGRYSRVPVQGDLRFEQAETFFVNLFDPTNATIDDGRGRATIANNDVIVRLGVTKDQSSTAAKGFVRPPHPGIEMTVRYYVRGGDGSWGLVATRRPTLGPASDFDGDGRRESRYSTTFPRASGNRCKIVARFPGDAHHRAGTATRLFAC